MAELLKILGALGAIFGFYKITIDVLLAIANKHREEYQFAKDYIQDINDPSVHNFVIEKGFRAMTGNCYSIGGVKYLLSYNEPTKAIMLRASPKESIKFDSSIREYKWSGFQQNKYCRKFTRWLYPLLYLLFASIVL